MGPRPALGARDSKAEGVDGDEEAERQDSVVGELLDEALDGDVR